MVFVVAKKQFIKCQSYHDIETNQSTGFYMIATLAFNEFSDNNAKMYQLIYVMLHSIKRSNHWALIGKSNLLFCERTKTLVRNCIG